MIIILMCRRRYCFCDDDYDYDYYDYDYGHDYDDHEHEHDYDYDSDQEKAPDLRFHPPQHTGNPLHTLTARANVVAAGVVILVFDAGV